MENVFAQLTDVFNWVVQSSVFAIASIAVIAAAQFAGRRLLPARWLYALWLLLLIRLILPSVPESRMSLWNFLPRAVMEDRFIPSYEVFTIDSNGENAAQIRPPGDDGAAFLQIRALSTREALSIIWLAGSLAMIAVIAVNNFRLWHSVRKLRQVTDHSLLELFEDCKQLMRVRTVVGLVITDQVKSPSLFGCIRPRVLLPTDLAEQIPREELRFIFLHELSHLKQGDIWIGWIVAFAQSLHWFNPLIWWAFARMRADREVACDAMALSRVNGEDSDRYGGALIGLLERFHYSRRLPVVAGILENKAQLKRRLNMITNFRHSTRREIIAAAALLAVLSIALLTNPPTLLSQPGMESDEHPNVQRVLDMMRESAESGTLSGDKLSAVMWPGADGGVNVTYIVPGSGRLDVEIDTSPGSRFFATPQNLKQLFSQLKEEYAANPAEDDILVKITRPDGKRVANVIVNGNTFQVPDDNYAINNFYEMTSVTDQPGFSVDIPSQKPLPIGGGVMQSRLIHRVDPIYPQEARDEGISGVVVLTATINEEGVVTDLAVASGPPLLIMSAIDAVRQWRYAPTLLNGVPVPVITEVRVTFTLG